MSDEIVIKAKSTTDIKNGSVIVSVGEIPALDENGAPASGLRICLLYTSPSPRD